MIAHYAPWKKNNESFFIYALRKEKEKIIN